MFNKTAICFSLVSLFVASLIDAGAAELSEGDVIVDDLRGVSAFYVLRRNNNYAAELLIWGHNSPIYPVDRSRNRIYSEDAEGKYYYVDLYDEPLRFEKVDFIPEGMKITSVAPNGSCLILTKPVRGDIFEEENPIFDKPYNLTGLVPDMLFRYDMASGEITRLTYSYSQKKSWVSTDGKCLAYRRHLGLGKGEMTIMFCRTDGTGKYDLQNYLREAGIDKEVLYNEEVIFAPKARLGPKGDTVYCAVFRPNVYPREEFWLNPEYYVATLYYEGDELNCAIEKKYIDLPAGTSLTYFYSAFSNPEVIYFRWRDLAGRGGLMRYDVKTDKFEKIRFGGIYASFFIY